MEEKIKTKSDHKKPKYIKQYSSLKRDVTPFK